MRHPHPARPGELPPLPAGLLLPALPGRPHLHQPPPPHLPARPAARGSRLSHHGPLPQHAGDERGRARHPRHPQPHGGRHPGCGGRGQHCRQGWSEPQLQSAGGRPGPASPGEGRAPGAGQAQVSGVGPQAGAQQAG